MNLSRMMFPLADRRLFGLLGAVFTPARDTARDSSLFTQLASAHLPTRLNQHEAADESHEKCEHRSKETHKIQRPPNHMIPHTGTVLTPPPAHQHDAVLLDIVALSGDVGRDRPAGGQPHTGRLALARVGLLGPRDADLEAHALAHRRVNL